MPDCCIQETASFRHPAVETSVKLWGVVTRSWAASPSPKAVVACTETVYLVAAARPVSVHDVVAVVQPVVVGSVETVYDTIATSPSTSGGVQETVAMVPSTVAFRAVGGGGGLGRSAAWTGSPERARVPLEVSTLISIRYEAPGTTPGKVTVGVVESVTTRTEFHAEPVWDLIQSV